jgi:hypothetical protein
MLLLANFSATAQTVAVEGLGRWANTLERTRPPGPVLPAYAWVWLT